MFLKQGGALVRDGTGEMNVSEDIVPHWARHGGLLYAVHVADV